MAIKQTAGREALGEFAPNAQVGEYQLPLLTLPQTDDYEPLGKYGRMRLTYLKTQRPMLYNQMLLNGTLWLHLQDALI